MENANESNSIENNQIVAISMSPYTTETHDEIKPSFKIVPTLIETISLEGHNSNPKSLKEDISDSESSDDDDSEDEYEDFLADEVLDLDILDLDADRRSILRDVKVMTAIDEEDREEQTWRAGGAGGDQGGWGAGEGGG